jgi:hypothetical protein
VARGTPTVALFAAGTGINCAALGTTFTGKLHLGGIKNRRPVAGVLGRP